MILIGQVNILSWGQLGCTRVPRPFLLTAKGLILRLGVESDVDADMKLWCLPGLNT